MMNKIIKSKIFQVIGAACQIYLGLSWLGIISGWANVDTVFSKVGGVLFLILGIMTSIGVFKKGA